MTGKKDYQLGIKNTKREVSMTTNAFKNLLPYQLEELCEIAARHYCITEDAEETAEVVFEHAQQCLNRSVQWTESQAVVRFILLLKEV